jgi:hypothetical protein
VPERSTPDTPDGTGAAQRDARPEVFQNEFAMVEVSRYETETGPRLHIRDLATGAEIFLDPLELEGLTRWTHEDFATLVDPSGLIATGEPDPDQV